MAQGETKACCSPETGAKGAVIFWMILYSIFALTALILASGGSQKAYDNIRKVLVTAGLKAECDDDSVTRILYIVTVVGLVYIAMLCILLRSVIKKTTAVLTSFVILISIGVIGKIVFVGFTLPNFNIWIFLFGLILIILDCVLLDVLNFHRKTVLHERRGEGVVATTLSQSP